MQRDIWAMNELEAGTYLVYIQMDWIQDLTEDYGFSVYSEYPIKLEDVTFQEQNFLYDVYTWNLAKQTVDPNLLSINNFTLNNTQNQLILFNFLWTTPFSYPSI
ncbi:unnamed protein product [Blepharisma stoltei]|uniref:Uncharacterized protein n=1 Tax=Blepharisma stoltei TaxID=1481888 RepID=A0AAU9IVH2_9CILI|nr:unnamed protein product [Blepharisma stoltei]